MVSLVIHIAFIAYALVHWTTLGFKGASLATSISVWIQLIIFGLFMFFSKHITWDYTFSFEPFHLHHILTKLKLALPTAAMIMFFSRHITYVLALSYNYSFLLILCGALHFIRLHTLYPLP